jgi:polygalacturonase
LDKKTQLFSRRSLIGSAAVMATPALAVPALDAPAAASALPDPAGRVFEVTAFGAVGDGVADDQPPIQRALDAAAAAGGGTVVLTPGKVFLLASRPTSSPQTTLLLIRANTRIVAYGAAVKVGIASALLANVIYGVDNFPGHSGPGNICIEGGIWDFNAGTAPGMVSGAAYNGLIFSHCENVTVRDAAFRNIAALHGIELNAVKRARIENCAFEGMYDFYGTPGWQESEAIQLDSALEGVGGCGPYDGTPCHNVIVKGCTARAYGTNGPPGTFVGTHSTNPNAPYGNIHIVDNVVEDMLRYAIRGMGWNEVVITGNTIQGRKRQNAGGGIMLRIATKPAPSGPRTSNHVVIANNVLTETGGPTSKDAAIHIMGTSGNVIYDIAINGNVIRNHQGTGAVMMDWAGRVVASGNIVSGGSTKIGSTNSTNVVIANNPGSS